MPASELQRKALFFIILAAIVIILLTAIPFVENWLQTIFLPQFGWQFESPWHLAPDSAKGDMMSSTYVALLEHFFRLLKIFLTMALVVAIVRFFTYLFLGRLSEGKREISSLLRTVVSVVIYIIAFAIIFQAQYPGINLGSIFAGSAIFGIVVGLALQDTLGNLFAGIALQADQPFQVGDVVNIANRGTGVVENVSWRGVKIRTFQNKLLIISNSVLGKESIEVASKSNLNARLVNFSTLYANSPTRTVQVVRDAVRLAENVSQKIRPIVRIRNLGDSGIEWEVKYWTENYTKYNDTDALVRQRIWYAFQREKIEFAYPTRTIHVETKPQETAFEEHINTVTERLNNVSIFAPLSDEETERLAQASTFRVYAPGEAIVRIGQEGRSMFVIMRGSVEVQIPQETSIRVLNTLRENDFFGEMSLLTGEPRTATVVAVEETEVLQIRKSAIKPIFEANPELVRAISEMVEERRGLLRSFAEKETDIEERREKGMLRSIRRFFGLK
ncbi:MAG TPA: mechanosensitive ion channel family protein [Pyrinomonadaceae bacterium]|nr:mechanosensitive ion channel family protein [Pyrinomonadaceae bacterium]